MNYILQAIFKDEIGIKQIKHFGKNFHIINKFIRHL